MNLYPKQQQKLDIRNAICASSLIGIKQQTQKITSGNTILRKSYLCVNLAEVIYSISAPA